jgi:acyl-CoA synthetase (AMP-forming)/AMP-acid ligase II
MKGLMQEHGLLISSVIRHAAANHGDREIVSRQLGGTLHRTNYREVERRSRRLAAALVRFGIRDGDRVATLAMNTFRHLECFYGISGMGAILHTVNPRLFADQIAYIINHAENRVLLFDPWFAPLVESLAPALKTIERFVVLGELAAAPAAKLTALSSYDQLIETGEEDFEWPVFDEHTASALCYTSGTTGHPKGVLYSHRSTLLHAMSTLQADAFGLRAVDVVLPVVPMYHVHAWSTPYGCAMCGAKLVLPGNQLDPRSIVELIHSEEATFALGVPTVWSTLISHLRDTGQLVPTLQRALIGGSALPPAIYKVLEQTYGVRPIHAWGMTETSPIGTIATTTAHLEELPAEERTAELLKQGRPTWGVEFKVTDPDGSPLPSDGKSSGLLWIRGPWAASGYFKRTDENVLDADGWFPTGDVATRDGDGFIKITDRAKDVIKSGGEWISSIDIENIAMMHPKVRFAAAVGVHHPKWDERPILIVTLTEGAALTAHELLEFLRPRMAKWWLPDAVVFVTELPLTATGKVLKAQLRERYRNYLAE